MTQIAMPFSSMQLRVELRHIRPVIWRQLVVPARATLDVLHDVLQLSFGWQDCHLHEFECGGVRIGPTSLEDMLVVDETRAPLGAVASAGSTFLYRYDFGDDWEHDVTVEEVSDGHTIETRVECLGGARCGPPEDAGGPERYMELLGVLADPSHPEHDELKAWAPRRFDAERFDVEKLNKKLAVMARHFARSERPGGRRPRRVT